MRTHRSFALPTLALAVFAVTLGSPEPARAQVVAIEYEAFDLDDAFGPGGDLWEYHYAVSDPGAVFAEHIGFSIYFPPALFRDLQNPPPSVSYDWDVLALQPIPGLPANGIYDALALVGSPSLNDPFTVSFIWLGGPGTQPGTQQFDVNEFDEGGGFVGVLQTGTTVPEPATGVLVLGGAVLAALARRRKGMLALLLAFGVVSGAAFAQGAADISLDGIEKVSERRVSRTVFEYTYSARARNNGTERQRDVRTQIFPTTGGVTMVDDAVAFGNIAAGTTAAGGDTFIFQVDRTQPFDPASLFFFFTVAPPEAPAITNLTAPASVARGTAFSVEFDYTDADGDIQVLAMSRHDALMNRSAEYGPSAAGITGEGGHATLTFDTNALPFGPAEFTVYLQDSLFQVSSVETFTVDITGVANTGVAPVVTTFARVAASYDRPAGAHDTAQAEFSLAITDADADLALVRVRITPPGGTQRVSDVPVANLALTGAGGAVTAPLLGFDTASQNGSYTVQVMPFDRNGHAGVPASATVLLVSSGGAVPRLFLADTSVADGGPGTEVDITGSGFNTSLPAQTVFEIAGIPCEIISITTTTARIRIPVGARTGPITALNPNGSSAMAAVNFIVPEHIVIEPAADENVAVSVGATATFSATIGSGREDKSLTWRVNGIAGGSAALGTVSADGVYTAPAEIPPGGVVQITASLTAAPAVASAATPVTILPPPGSPGSAGVLAALGGTVPSADQRAQVSIPPGALAANTTITARTLAQPELPDSGLGRRMLGGAEFGPSGTAFSSPVTVTIPLAVSRPPGTALRCRFYQGGGVFVDEGVIAIVNASGSAATAAITHFSMPILDEPAPVSPPATAPTLTGIAPAEIDEGSCRPIRLIGTGLTDDLRVEIRNGDGTPVSLGDMGPGTLFVAGTSAGFVLSSGTLGGFDSGTRTYRVRLVRSHDDSLFAEIPINVRGLPEFTVAPEELVVLDSPPLMRVSRVFVGERARVVVRSGVLAIDSLGDVKIEGLITGRGRDGASANHQNPGAGGGTGGAGGLGREDGDIFLLGFHDPESENFGRHGNDPVGFADIDYQAPAPRPLDTFTRAPRGLGGPPGHNIKITIPIPNPVSIAAAVGDLIRSSVAFVDRDIPGRRGLGAPAYSSFPQPSGGGGGGGGRFSFSTLSLVDVDVYGGGGGGGGGGGAGVQIRGARTVFVNRTGAADVRGGNGGDGANRSTLGVSLLFGLIPIYEDPDVDAFSGGGGGGGRSGTLEVTGAEGIFLDSERDQLVTGGGKGGKGGVVDVDVENESVLLRYDASPETDGEYFNLARNVNRPIFPERTFLAQVVDHGLLRLSSEPTYLRAGAVVIDVTGEGPGQHRTVTARFNGTTNRYEATVLLYPGFNKVVDPMVGYRDPLHAPRVLVLDADIDNDGITNNDEATFGTNSALADTDDDGVNDGDEVLAGTNPLVPPAARPDTSFAPVFTYSGGNGIINALATQPYGKIVVGGHFNSVNGQPRGGIARLNADGTLDSGFNPGGTGPDGPVFAVAVQRDGKTLLGGQFNNVAGQPRYRLARLNADGTLESTATFNAAITPPGQVNCIALQLDGKILIGGNFDGVAGQSRRGLARLNTDGTLDTTFATGAGITFPIGNFGDFSGIVYAVAVQPDGKILAGGEFTKAGGETHNRLARFSATGAVESAFAPVVVGNYVNAVALQPDGRILIGGQFSVVNGQARGCLARLNADGTLESSATFAATDTNGDAYISSFALQTNGSIVVAGVFTSLGGQPRTRIARLLPDGTVEPVGGFDPPGGANNEVNALALQADGAILVGGHFTMIAGQPSSGLARLKNDAAPQMLAATSAARVTWLRDGAAAEAADVVFEMSINDGANWSALGAGTRIASGWERAGLNLSGNGLLRARARTVGGEHGGSAGLVEQIAAFNLPAGTLPSAFRQWTLAHLGDANASELGDPDGDGIPTLVEYGLNLSPEMADPAPFAITRGAYAGGERLRLFIQRDPAHNDVTVKVQAAGDLAGPWITIATSAFGTAFSGPGYVGGDSATPGIKTVEIRDTVDIASAPRRFLRVQVTR